MKSVINFKSEQELEIYLKSRKLQEIGDGSEGVCFKSKVDNLAYKIFDAYGEQGIEYGEYNIEDIITEADIKLESFIFPKTLLAINNQFKGYTSIFVENNQLDFEYIEDNFYNLNINKLIKAYARILKDVIKLSEKNIVIYDLIYNLLFDGERLYAIDTCGYYKSKETNVLEQNIRILNMAIITMFEDYFNFEEERPNVDKTMDVVQYLEKVGIYIKNNKTKKSAI